MPPQQHTVIRLVRGNAHADVTADRITKINKTKISPGFLEYKGRVRPHTPLQFNYIRIHGSARSQQARDSHNTLHPTNTLNYTFTLEKNNTHATDM